LFVYILSGFMFTCVGSGLATGVIPTAHKINHFIINSEWEQAREPNPPRKKSVSRRVER
jgi:hypothetical protein